MLSFLGAAQNGDGDTVDGLELGILSILFLMDVLWD